MSSVLSDLRHSLRVLTCNPAFTTVAVAALALGMGSTHWSLYDRNEDISR